MLLERYFLLVLRLAVVSNGCMRANFEHIRDIRDSSSSRKKEGEILADFTSIQLQNVWPAAPGFEARVPKSPDEAIEYPLTRVPRSTPYLGRDWEQINPYGPAPLSPTTPMSPYNSSAFKLLRKRKAKRLQTSERQAALMNDKLSGVFDQTRRTLGSSLSEQAPVVEDDEDIVTESTKVSLKLTVLDAFAPTTIIRRPNVYRTRKEQILRKRRRLNGKTRFRLIYPNKNRTSRLIPSTKHPEFSTYFKRGPEENKLFKHGMNTGASRQTISIGLNVLPLGSNSTTIAANFADTQPRAEPLKQTQDFLEVEYEDSLLSFAMSDDEMVCQIHRCGEYVESSPGPAQTSPSLAIDMEIDFHVGTNILKDIWNNHINADKMIGLQVLDKDDEIDEEDYALDGMNFEKGNVDISQSGQNYVVASNTSITNEEFQSNVTGQSEQNNFVHPEESSSSSEDESPILISTHKEFLSEEPVRETATLTHTHDLELDASTVDANGELFDKNAHKFFTLPQNLAESSLSGPALDDAGNPTVDSVLVQNFISPEEGTTDFFIPTSIDPVSTHLLPPSVLPAIHKDAVEGRVVQSGLKTRIILRLKPSHTHPAGEIVVVPASKFDKFGTADIVLDSGRKISVKLKSKDQSHPTSNSKPKSVIQNQNVDVSYDPVPGNETPQNIPLTILRDAVSGEPVMVMPGLTPNENSVFRWQDLKLAENMPAISQMLEFPHQFHVPQAIGSTQNIAHNPTFVNPSLNNLNSQSQPFNDINFQNFNTNGFAGTEVPSSIFGQNFATMTSRLQSGIRNLMDRVSGVTNRMEENVVGSFQNSVDFLRVFYENVLPENYSDDSMTMISIAAFLAFLGARFSDITSALGTSAVGRTALSELETFLGEDVSQQVEEFFRTLTDSRKFDEAKEDNLGRSFRVGEKNDMRDRGKLITDPFLSSDAGGKSSATEFLRNPFLVSRKHPGSLTESLSQATTREEQTPSTKASEEDLTDQEFYAELQQAAEMWRQHLDKLSLSEPRSLPCVQRELCFLNTAGVRKGGFSAFITPLISVGVAAAHSTSRGALAFLDALRPLWMAQSSTDPSACEALRCVQ